MCRFNRLGRSKALPHTSHGSRARSPRCGRALGEARGKLMMVLSSKSPPVLLAVDEVDDADDDDDDDDVIEDDEDSPETDLCSS